MGEYKSKRWLVTGATGLIGPALCAQARAAGIEVLATSRSGHLQSHPVDLSIPGAIGAHLEAVQPDAVIHLGAISHPAQVARDLPLATRVNVAASEEIARWCSRNNRWHLFASTDQVFDGRAGPYAEDAPATPVTAYGAMKLAAEQFTLDAGGLVVRLGWVLNDCGIGRADFVRKSLPILRDGGVVCAVDDEYRTPATLSLVVQAICQLAKRRETGIVHVAGDRHVTPYQILLEAALEAGLPGERVRRDTRLNLEPADRPADLRLNTDRLAALMFATSPADATPQKIDAG